MSSSMFVRGNGRYPRTHLFSFFKFNQLFMRYGKWTISELPLLPKVAFVHKTMKSALASCEEHLSQDYLTRIRQVLCNIRVINWNIYNTPGMPYHEIQRVKKLLLDLYNHKSDLPKPLAIKLENVCVFDSLRNAIDTLDERSSHR